MSETQEHAEASPKVGYRSPPVATRWKPGQSGNPKGKPKGAKNLATVVIKEAKSKVVVKDVNGASKKLSKLEATFALLTVQALKGNLKAMQMVLAQFKEHLPAETEKSLDISEPTPEDLQALHDHAKLIELLNKASPDDVSAD
jgi:hypothetical protein